MNDKLPDKLQAKITSEALLADEKYIQTIRRLKKEGAEYIDSQFFTALYMLGPGAEFTGPQMTDFMNEQKEKINSIIEAALEGRDARVGAYLSALEMFADEICCRLRDKIDPELRRNLQETEKNIHNALSAIRSEPEMGPDKLEGILAAHLSPDELQILAPRPLRQLLNAFRANPH